jgi:acyl-[acyl-carrier-protein] desaturase
MSGNPAGALLAHQSSNVPAFPDSATLDGAIYDYLRRADRMGWSPYDLVEQNQIATLARPERITEVQLSALKTVLYVEDHLPGYLAEHLRLLTDPDVSAEQQIINRKLLRFSFRWVSEEDRHSHVLSMYLTKTGLMKEAELEADLLQERKTSYAFPYERVLDTFVYLALQEKATTFYYRALAKDIDEPLLKLILSKMAADEASHGAFFYKLLIQYFQGDFDALARRISAVSNDFKMPVQNGLRNYRRQLLNMMRAAPSYRHPDVFTHMMRAVDRAASTYDRQSLGLITPEE